MVEFKALLVEGKSTTVGTVRTDLPSDKILVKSVAFAANPTDWKHLDFGLAKEGAIVGNDVAGVVEEVGSDVQGFQKGDIVGATLRGATSTTQGCFGEYAICNPVSTIKFGQLSSEQLPEGDNQAGKVTTFEGAAALPLGMATVGLSFSHQLKLTPEDAGKTILIWGGATATGMLAIQIAKKIFGLKVVATASPKNFDTLKGLGADHLVSYHDADAVDQIKKWGQGQIKYGFDTVSVKETFQSVYDATEGSGDDVRLDNLLFLNADSITTKPDHKVATFGGTLVYTVDGNDQPFGPATIPSSPELVADFTHFWTKLLPPKLAEITHPKLRVLAPGLKSADEAFELLKNNKVSAEKVVWRYGEGARL
ncbi:hypothetical protein DICA0_F37148 [Diutina catenulata]